MELDNIENQTPISPTISRESGADVYIAFEQLGLIPSLPEIRENVDESSSTDAAELIVPNASTLRAVSDEHIAAARENLAYLSQKGLISNRALASLEMESQDLSVIVDEYAYVEFHEIEMNKLVEQRIAMLEEEIRSASLIPSKSTQVSKMAEISAKQSEMLNNLRNIAGDILRKYSQIDIEGVDVNVEETIQAAKMMLLKLAGNGIVYIDQAYSNVLNQELVNKNRAIQREQRIQSWGIKNVQEEKVKEAEVVVPEPEVEVAKKPEEPKSQLTALAKAIMSRKIVTSSDVKDSDTVDNSETDTKDSKVEAKPEIKEILEVKQTIEAIHRDKKTERLNSTEQFSIDILRWVQEKGPQISKADLVAMRYPNETVETMDSRFSFALSQVRKIVRGYIPDFDIPFNRGTRLYEVTFTTTIIEETTVDVVEQPTNDQDSDSIADMSSDVKHDVDFNLEDYIDDPEYWKSLGKRESIETQNSNEQDDIEAYNVEADKAVAYLHSHHGTQLEALNKMTASLMHEEDLELGRAQIILARAVEQLQSEGKLAGKWIRSGTNQVPSNIYGSIKDRVRKLLGRENYSVGK